MRHSSEHVLFYKYTACSRDGSVRLWDCGESKCLAVLSKGDCPVNSCALTELQGMENTSGAADQHSKNSYINLI